MSRFIAVYFGDILYYSKSIEEHIDHVWEVFTVLRKNELFVNLKKCIFITGSLVFLGFMDCKGSGWTKIKLGWFVSGWLRPLLQRYDVSLVWLHSTDASSRTLVLLLPLLLFVWKRSALSEKWRSSKPFLSLRRYCSHLVLSLLAFAKPFKKILSMAHVEN